MSNGQMRELCIALLHADSEAEVTKILEQAAYWQDAKSWRLYGDSDNNYATIGNQQSCPEAALVEKIVRCVDARLMNECLQCGIDKSGPDGCTVATALEHITSAAREDCEKRDV